MSLNKSKILPLNEERITMPRLIQSENRNQELFLVCALHAQMSWIEQVDVYIISQVTRHTVRPFVRGSIIIIIIINVQSVDRHPSPRILSSSLLRVTDWREGGEVRSVFGENKRSNVPLMTVIARSQQQPTNVGLSLMSQNSLEVQLQLQFDYGSVLKINKSV